MAYVPLGRLCFPKHTWRADGFCDVCGIPERGSDERYIFDFWRRVDKTDPSGCWMWRGSILWNGYGQVSWQGRMRKTHHVAWMLAGRECPDWSKRMTLDHICERRACVCVDHLRVMTLADNVRRGIANKVSRKRT